MTDFYRTLSFEPPNETDALFALFPHQRSSACQTISHMETLEETTISIRSHFPRNDQVSCIQKDLDLLTIIFRSVLDQLRLVDDPDTSQLLIFYHFLQYHFKNYYIFQTIPAISKYQTTLSIYSSSMGPFHEFFDFEKSRYIPPPTPISQFKDLTLNRKQKLDEYIGSLPSANPDFFPLTLPTTLQATESTPNTPTQVANTIYLNINDSTTPV